MLIRVNKRGPHWQENHFASRRCSTYRLNECCVSERVIFQSISEATWISALHMYIAAMISRISLVVISYVIIRLLDALSPIRAYFPNVCCFRPPSHHFSRCSFFVSAWTVYSTQSSRRLSLLEDPLLCLAIQTCFQQTCHA